MTITKPERKKALGISMDTTGGVLVPEGRVDDQTDKDNKDKDKGDSKMRKGAISYKAAHPEGTPLADKGDKWDASGECAKCSNADHLKAIHAGFKGGKEDDAANYDFPHHGGTPPHPVHLKAVQKLANKFKPEEKMTIAELKAELKADPNMPNGDEWAYTTDDTSTMLEHLSQHLSEFQEPVPWLTGDQTGKDVKEPETKGISSSDKASLQAGINKESLSDLSAYHRRLHMMAAQGNNMTGFSTADMNWLHSAVETAMCKAHKAQDPPTECAPASPLEWKKGIDMDEIIEKAKAEKPKPDEEGEGSDKEEREDVEEGKEEEEKCSHITDVTGQIAEREKPKKGPKPPEGSPAEEAEETPEEEEEEEEEAGKKPEKKDATEPVVKVGRKISKANADALNEALGHFSEGFDQHKKGMDFHEKVTKAHLKAAECHDEAMKCYNKGVDKLNGIIKALGSEKPEEEGSEEEAEKPEAGKPEVKEISDDIMYKVNPTELAKTLKEFRDDMVKTLDLDLETERVE